MYKILVVKSKKYGTIDSSEMQWVRKNEQIAHDKTVCV